MNLLDEVKKEYAAKTKKDEKVPEKIRTAKNAKNTLLPIEQDMAQRLDEEVTKLELLETCAFDEKYKRIDLSFLTRRRRQGRFGWQKSVPAFACFEPTKENGGTFSIKATLEYGEIIPKVSPSCVQEYFVDVAENIIRARLQKIIKCQISCKFDGAIPSHARKIIKRADEEFNGNVLLIMEAPQWKVDLEVKEPPPDPDPLIVGYDDQGRAWLIDSFDLTDVEHAIKSEFCL